MNYKTGSKNVNIIEITKFKSIWSQEEHRKMLVYLSEQREELVDHVRMNIERESRTNKNNFFVKMSKYIGTKSDKQCKSRYQKKEEMLFKAIHIPLDLVERYFSGKRSKSGHTSFKKRQSIQSTDTSNSMLRPVDTILAHINNFADLKAFLEREFMPKVTNETVKAYLDQFLSNLPTSEEALKDFSLAEITSLHQFHPRANFSLEVIEDRECIFFEDYE